MTAPEYKNQLKTEKLLEYINKARENKKFMQNVEIGFTILLIAFFALQAILPTFRTISGLIGEIKTKRETIQKMQKKILDIDLAQKTYAEIQNEFPQIESCLPYSPSFYNASKQIRSVASLESVDIGRIGFNLKTDNINANNTKSFNTSLSIKSDFVKLTSFLNKLSKLRRPIQISSVTLNLIEEKESSSSAGINFNINPIFYYLPK